MRIAIIGSGISGLVAARHLHAAHELTVFEANDYAGGHTNTVSVNVEGESHAVDTGFIVFNDRTYPNFCRLLHELEVESVPTSMSFSVRADEDQLEYQGSSLSGLFAQKRNLMRPGFYRMIRDILRFNREALDLAENSGDEQTVGEFLTQHRYSSQFARHYLLPMGAAIWSCPTGTFRNFPIGFICDFYRNHGLLSLKNRPTWRVIKGGSRNYVEALTRPFRDRILLRTPVRAVVRRPDCVMVESERGLQHYDEVIFACHSDQALSILGEQASSVEKSLLGSIPYEANTAVLHTDISLLPRRRSAWASLNYHIPAGTSDHAMLTYNMSILQQIESRHTFCVTLNEDSAIDPEKIIARFRYSHPVFTTQRRLAQARHRELIRNDRLSFCGAYWGNGFHEDGVNSARAVASAFEDTPIRLESGDPVHA